jgi:hypothetical protein
VKSYGRVNFIFPLLKTAVRARHVNACLLSQLCGRHRLEDSDPSLAWAESETLSIKKPKGNVGWKCGSNSMALAQSP